MNKCITINISDLKTSCLLISFFVKLYFSSILLLCLWFPAKKAATSPGKGFVTAGDRNIKAMLIYTKVNNKNSPLGSIMERSKM